MKKEYVSPDFKAFKVTLDDIILSSTEEPIPEVIGGDEGGNNPPAPSDPLNDF